jgi:hypothetical protein
MNHAAHRTENRGQRGGTQKQKDSRQARNQSHKMSPFSRRVGVSACPPDISSSDGTSSVVSKSAENTLGFSCQGDLQQTGESGDGDLRRGATGIGVVDWRFEMKFLQLCF